MKVAAVVPPASLNLGNDFFAEGGMECFRQVFSEHEMDIHYIEFFDSGENGFAPNGQTSYFTPATLEWIKKEADLVVLFAGCALHEGQRHLFQPLLDTGVPFIGWGLSPTSYNDSDVKFAKEISDKSLALITRDNLIAELVGEYPKFISGMDGGWWMGDSYKRPGKSTGYTVINIEEGNSLNVGQSLAKYDELKSQDKMVYMVSNNCERNCHHMHPGSLLITSARHLYTTFANAEHVITTRAHTTICCLTNGVPVEYVGHLDYRTRSLMATVGVDMGNLSSYNPDDVQKIVASSKKNFVEMIRDKVKL